jgi:hypothetical protein
VAIPPGKAAPTSVARGLCRRYESRTMCGQMDVARTLAAALAGDRRALAEVAGSEELRPAVARARIASALALRAAELGVGGPEVEGWRRELMRATSLGLLLRHSLAGIAATLGRAGIAWAPLKGLGLAPHVYPRWEERPTLDVDVLVGYEEFAPARAALAAAGWRDAAAVEGGDEFLADEGYNWKAADAADVPLELHFRLWGCAPEGLAAAIASRWEADPGAGTTARRLRLADAYLIGAVHWWTAARPRPLLYLWDLRRIAVAAPDGFTDEVLGEVRRWGLELLVVPVAAAAAALWDDGRNRAIAAGARAGLRSAERLMLRRIVSAGAENAGLEAVALARLLARRESRMGWRAAWRRVWPHPAVLREKTPEAWSWARRRAWFAAHRLGLIKG